MISEGLRKHSFWLYGVIVGLSIKSALDIVGDHAIVPPNNSYSGVFLEFARLSAFLLISIQFYLGSVWFFDKFYETNSIEAHQACHGYAPDYLFGLGHFIMFFGWAMSIDTHRGHLRLFPILMVLILMYHALWCWASRGRGTYAELRKRAWLNFGLVVFTISVYSVAYLILNAVFETMIGPIKHRIAEALSLVPVVTVSTVDIIGLMRDRQLIADAVIDRFKTH